jgi:hypothetical protein
MRLSAAGIAPEPADWIALGTDCLACPSVIEAVIHVVSPRTTSNLTRRLLRNTWPLDTRGVCPSSESRADTSAMPAASPPAKPSDMTAGIDAVYSGT